MEIYTSHIQRFTWLNFPREVWFPVFVLHMVDFFRLRFPLLNLNVNINSMKQKRGWEDGVRAWILRDNGNILIS